MADERFDLEAAIGNQIENRLEVPLRGPAHVRVRVVPAALFIRRIVAAWTVGAGNLQAEFFPVKLIAAQLEPGEADHHDPPALA